MSADRTVSKSALAADAEIHTSVLVVSTCCVLRSRGFMAITTNRLPAGRQASQTPPCRPPYPLTGNIVLWLQLLLAMTSRVIGLTQ